MTIVFVTHSIDEAIVLGDRIVVMTIQPGTTTTEFAVALPRPRDKAGDEFTGLFLEVRHALADQVVRHTGPHSSSPG